MLNSVGAAILEELGGLQSLRDIMGVSEVWDVKGKGVGFQWPNRQRARGNAVEITLAADGTYTVRFLNMILTERKVVRVAEGLYDLAEVADVIEKQTGWVLGWALPAPKPRQAAEPESPPEAVYLLPLFVGLRAQYWMYQTLHWQASGEEAYAKHLLFQRLYEAVQGEVDALAEKIAGIYGAKWLNTQYQLALFAPMLNDWGQDTTDGIAVALRSEEALQELFKSTYDTMKARDALTLGLDDWLMATASAHETSLYLLRQHVANPAAFNRVARLAMQWKSAQSEELFFDNPQKRSIREFADSGAVTNEIPVAKTFVEETSLSETPRQVVQDAKQTPDTPNEVLESTPGASQFSTLSQMLVQTAEPITGAPEGRDDLPKHPKIARRRLTWPAA